MKASSSSATKPVSPAPPPPAPAGRGKRILLADDDPGVRESLAAALRSDGYVVFAARDGQEALDLAFVNGIDLVLLDLNMPVRNGWDTFERLTAADPLLPVIIVTARPNQWFTALSAGVGALLEKPMDIPTLLTTVSALLAESAEARLARLAGRHADFIYRPAGQHGGGNE